MCRRLTFQLHLVFVTPHHLANTMRLAVALTVTLLLAISGAEDNSTAVVQGVIAANRDNNTALHVIKAPAWVASPEVRGTLSIVWSCLVTLAASVYTALHLNIPVVAGIWARLLYKAKWVAVALLAPELVLYVASQQFFEARHFQTEMKTLLRDRGRRAGDPDEVRQMSSPGRRRTNTNQEHILATILFFRRDGRPSSIDRRHLPKSRGAKGTTRVAEASCTLHVWSSPTR